VNESELSTLQKKLQELNAVKRKRQVDLAATGGKKVVNRLLPW